MKKIFSTLTAIIFIITVCMTGAFAAGALTVSASYSNSCISISGSAEGYTSVIVQVWDDTSSMISMDQVDVVSGSYSYSANIGSKRGNFTVKVAPSDGGAFVTTTVNAVDTISVTGVTLNKTSLSLVEGTYETLVATVEPADASNTNVTWQSSDNNIATVDADGKVTAVSAGNATITVTTSDGGKTATCGVTVTASVVNVTGVTLNKTSLSLVEGTYETLVATVEPVNASNTNVTWQSSDNNIATVDADGKVTAVSTGNSTITVTTADGGKTATCGVTVTASVVNVTGVTLNKTSLVLKEGVSETLIATIKPDNASNTNITWSTSDSRIAIVDTNGKVTAKNEGNATIRVTTEDGGFIAECALTVEKKSQNNGNNTGETVDSNGNIQIGTDNVSSTGAAQVTVSANTVSESLSHMNGQIAVKVNTPYGTNQITVNIPRQLFASNVKTVTISTDLGSIAISPSDINAGAGNADMISFTIKTVDKNQLPASVVSAVGNNTVYDFSITANGQEINQFASEVKVTIPYTLKAGEDPNTIVIYYINSQGNLEVVPKCSYDPATQTVSFFTRHFSKYVAKYVSAGFTDLGNYSWAAQPINALYARNLINGVGNNKFAPERNITRAEFIKMLICALNLTDNTATASFADVPSSHWAYKYVASAKKLGITTGKSSTKFGANEYITRQDMAVLIFRALNIAKIQLPQDNSKPAFADISKAASYAVDAINAIYKAGIVSGSGNGKYNPNSNATRAEVAKIIYEAFKLTLE